MDSINLPVTHVIEIGLWLQGLLGEPFLNSGIIIADFQLAGNLDVDIDKLNNIDKGKASPLPKCLKSIAGKSSIPAQFLFLNFLFTYRTDWGGGIHSFHVIIWLVNVYILTLWQTTIISGKNL